MKQDSLQYSLPIWEGNQFSGLVAEYLFNGNADDSSGNGYNGTVNGATLTKDKWFRTDNAYDFDGINDYIDLGDQDAFSFTNGSTDLPFSVSCWFNLDVGATSNNALISKLQNAGGEWATLLLSDDRILLRCYTVPGVSQIGKLTTSSITRGVWNNVVFTYDGSENDNGMFIYLNGELINANSSSAGSYTGMTNTNIPARIGQYSTGGSDTFFDGKIDRVRIYNKVLSEKEIKNLYNEAIEQTKPLENQLEAYYPFNGNANDESGNGYNGTVNGAILTTDRFGNANSAYEFDGVDDYISYSLDPLPKTGSASFSVWVKKDSSFEGRYVISSGAETAEAGIALRIGSELPLYVGRTTTTNRNILSTTYTPSTDWTHYVMSYDDSTLTMNFYINGAYFGSGTNSSVSYGTNGDFVIGINSSFSTGFYFDGKIDDVRLYDRALQPNEVYALYENTNPKKYYDQLNSGLIAYYPMLSSANDYSENGYDGTVNGATLTRGLYGLENTAYDFDGVNDYISTGNLVGGVHQLSITAWVKNDGIGNSSIYSRWGSPPKNKIIFRIDSGSDFVCLLNTNTGAYSLIEQFVLNTGVWTMLTITYDGHSLKGFVDNHQIGNVTASGTINNDTGDEYIGADNRDDPGGPVMIMDGKITELRIYDRALEYNEIKAIYKLNKRNIS